VQEKFHTYAKQSKIILLYRVITYDLYTALSNIYNKKTGKKLNLYYQQEKLSKFPTEDINNSTRCCACYPVSTMVWLYAGVVGFMLMYAADTYGGQELVWLWSGLNLVTRIG
jgi:hypothetical protein